MVGTKAIVPETTSELQKIELMFTHLHKHLEYQTKLLESVVEKFSLADNSKEKHAEIVQMNSELMKSLFANRDFQGKEEFMAYIDKITKMGAGQ
jgi:hypothetical protein